MSDQNMPAESHMDDGHEQSVERINQELNLVLDIPVKVTVEIGKTEISIKRLLQLNQGSIVELDRMTNEPLDVKVNGKLIAHGEVVVVDKKFGVRLTEIINESERMQQLSES